MAQESKTKPAPQSREAGTPASLAFPGRKILGVAEVADRLAVSERHIIDLIDEGKLRALDLGGQHEGRRRLYRIPVEAYETFLQERAC